MESLFLPPVASSPFPKYKKSSNPICLASIARVGSHTRLARSFVISPSGISFIFIYKNSLDIISRTASPKNSKRSLSFIFLALCSLAKDVCVNAFINKSLSLNVYPIMFSNLEKSLFISTPNELP